MLTMQGGDSLVGGLPIIHITYQQYIANPSAYHDPDVIVHITGFPTAGNMPADYVGYDSTLNMEDIGNIATKAIAKVEPSDTALYLHNVGTYFINKNGNMCKTDLQISVGGTITLGTNCHVCSDGVANDINSNLSASLSSTGLSFINCNYVEGGYAKIGNLCVVNIRVTQTAGTSFRIDGFPTYSGQYNKVCLSGINVNTTVSVNGGLEASGTLVMKATGTDAFMISGCYVS